MNERERERKVMDRYTYTLKQEGDKKESRLYSRTELELMTAFQLRDICWRERIINGIQASMDRDELIRQIMRFRGRKEHLFITSYSREGTRRIEELLSRSRIQIFPEALRGCAKIIAYNGIGITCRDGFSIGYREDMEDTNAFLVSGNQICAVFQLRTYKGKKDRLYLTRKLP